MEEDFRWLVLICLLCFPSIFCCSLPLIHMSAVPEFELPKAVVARIIKGAVSLRLILMIWR